MEADLPSASWGSSRQDPPHPPRLPRRPSRSRGQHSQAQARSSLDRTWPRVGGEVRGVREDSKSRAPWGDLMPLVEAIRAKAEQRPAASGRRHDQAKNAGASYQSSTFSAMGGSVSGKVEPKQLELPQTELLWT